jgi:hypothetical protein
MNMNCSGHSELRDPDWYDPDRSLARARNPIIDADTASRMHNSLASLNVDGLTIAEMNDQSFNHFSVRSLPVVSSSANAVTRIATAPDAPWNESTRSLRVTSGVSASNNIPTMSSVRTSRATKPPPGVSALDHLQNSLSNIMVSAASPNNGLPHDIVALEDDSEYDSLAGDQDDSLNGSFVSLRLADVMNSGNEYNEMDETAHAGNVRTPSTQSRTVNHYQLPMSPLRSPIRSSQSYRHAKTDSNLNSSYASARSAPSPTRSVSARYRHYSAAAMNEAPSFSTLDEHTEYYNDGCDLGDNEDDNNTEIIKVLRTQIDTLKHELLKQQEQNQKLIHQYEYKNQISQLLPMDSIVQNGGGGGFFSCGNESFVSTRSAYHHGRNNNHRNVSSCEKNTDDFTQRESFLQQQKQLSDAELGIIGSIAALKSTMFKPQGGDKENREVNNIVRHEQQPVSPESDDSNNNANDDDNASISLLDELVLCELEAHIKAYQRISKMQFEALYQQYEQLQAKVSEQNTRIAELECQINEK